MKKQNTDNLENHSGILFSTVLLIIFFVNAAFIYWCINTINTYKKDITDSQENFRTEIRESIARQESLINQFIYTYGGN